MMRVAVVTSSPPLAEGGHMVIARSLVQALREAGHRAGIVVTPQNRFGRQAAAYVATWFTDVGMAEGEPIDRVISLRYPSYAVRHPHHVCWLNHTMREYYDLWPAFSSRLGRAGLIKERVRRRLTHAADRYLLTRNVTRLFVQSRTIQERLRMWPELRSTVLYPPPPQRAYRCDELGDYIFMVSRLTPLKRADLLLRALATEEGRGIRAVIAGDGEERPRLQALIHELGLDDRVTLAGPLPDEELLDHLARCRAVCFPPVQEDYGFVTVEAFASGKPVITCTDSGGPAELVLDGERGYVCSPDPASLARALRRVMDDRREAERMGAQAFAFVSELTWQKTIDTLTGVD
jgi:glycosyltransferase involved in cell wall biosynthesis